MIEDKLTRDERRRLECVAQAIVHSSHQGAASINWILEKASYMEKFVETGEVPEITPHVYK